MMQDVVRIASFDGQSIWLDAKTELFEVGNFLGGGAAGNVYECEHEPSRERYAIKVLNPLGFKITASSLLRKFVIISKGEMFDDSDRNAQVGKAHIWWLMNTATKQYLACYYTEKGSTIRELSLSQCMLIWGTDIAGINADDCNDSFLRPSGPNSLTSTPVYPPKYIDFLRKRDRIFREIRNMRKISAHPNVIKLVAVLELPQDSKCTLFLVMELANGGELFDRIKTDCGTCEDTAQYFFWQLLQGVQHCHAQGVCHRDLKPENLLLQGEGKDAILKIADFGFSAHFAECIPTREGISSSWSGDQKDSSLPDESPLRVLKSVVGSPFYVAPEVLQAAGYDGPKADVWSMGVILYAMLAGNLPFGHELATCKRFRQFCKWVREQTARGVRFWDNPAIEYPQWLFPSRFSPMARALLVAMLHPDPEHRITVMEAMKHEFCSGQKEAQYKQYQGLFAPPAAATPTATPTMPGAAASAAGDATFPSEAMDKIDSLEPANSMDATPSLPLFEDDEDEVFRMEEDESPIATKASRLAKKPPQAAVRAFPATPDTTFRTIPEAAASALAGAMLNKDTSRPLATPPTPPTPLPIVPPSYLTMPGLDDLLNEDAKGEMVELDSPLVPHHDPLMQSNPFLGIAMHPRADHYASHPLLPGAQANGYGYGYTASTGAATISSASASTVPSSGSAAAAIPAFNDRVKRSTRFLTIVPATVILEQVESVLQEAIRSKVETPAGYLGRVAVDWTHYRLEVFDCEHVHGPAIFALQLYQIPVGSAAFCASSSFSAHTSLPCSPDRQSFHFPSSYMSPSASPGHWFHNSTSSSYQQQQQQQQLQQQDLLLVEFIRGQLEIFAFKRFYQYIRQRLSDYVKRDYSCKLFDPAAASPMVDSYLSQRMQMT